jgi:hypothetical protein
MSAFHVGQKVVCVDNSERGQHDDTPPIAHWLEVGAVYVIRRLSNKKRPLVWVQGINRTYWQPGVLWTDAGFYADRFRPLIKRTTSTETGMQLLTDILKRETVDEPIKKRTRT